MSLGTIHRTINLFFSSTFAAGVMTTSILALQTAPGTAYDTSKWEGITMSAFVFTALQAVSNFPYVLITRRTRKNMFGRWVDRMWAGVHLISSFGCFILYLLTFYLDGVKSADLRTTFWSQFNFNVDPEFEKEYLCILVIFIDFVGSNFLVTLGVVFFPTVYRRWNHMAADAPIEFHRPTA